MREGMLVIFFEELSGFTESLDDASIIARLECRRINCEGEWTSISRLLHTDQEALEWHISFPGEESCFFLCFICEIDVSDRIPEEGECLHEVDTTLWLDIPYRECSM
jgi:hypothetical protein